MTFSIPVAWEPKIYLEAFGSAENLKTKLGLNIIAMNKQIVTKMINPESLAHLDSFLAEEEKDPIHRFLTPPRVLKTELSTIVLNRFDFIKKHTDENTNLARLQLRTGLTKANIYDVLLKVHGNTSVEQLKYIVREEKKKGKK